MIKSKALETIIDKKYSYTDKNLSIPIQFLEKPQNTKSFIIIFHDLHPYASDWTHWVVVDIPININEIPEGISNTDKMIGKELFNQFDQKGYGGPCPPKEDGYHEYQLSVFAMDFENIDTTKLYDGKYLSYKQLKDNFVNNIIKEYDISNNFKTE